MARTARTVAVVAALLAATAACTSDDTSPDDDDEQEPLRIDGPAHVDESLLESGPGARPDEGDGG